VRIIREDSHYELSFREESLNLLELVNVVKSHHLHTFLLSMGDVERVFAGICEDEVLLMVSDEFLDETHLVLGSTVETSTEGSKAAEDGRVWVAFHG
jgi:hypothetical protein